MTERDQNREAAVRLGAQLAAHMPGWSAVLPAQPEDDWTRDWCDMVRADGAAFRLRVGGWKNEGRVSVYGLFPSHKDGTQYTPRVRVSVTCSIKRAPNDIARDIERRFLPEYLDEYVRAVDSVRVHDRDQDEAAAVAERLASVIGGEVRDKSSRVAAPIGIWAKQYAIHSLQVRPGYESGTATEPVQVDFQVHGVSPETAAAMLAILAAADAMGGDVREGVVRVETIPEVPDTVVRWTRVLDASAEDLELHPTHIARHLRGRCP